MEKPKIRFKGYQEDWEQRKLDDVAEFSKGSGYSKGDLIESGTPIILYGRLYTKYETIISDVDTFAEAKDSSVYSKGGEVIVPASGETAEDIARAASVDKSGILLGGDLNIVMPNEDINSAFLAISISNGNSQRELARKAQGKSVVHIHNEEIRNLVVPFPTKTEQNKIVNYFADLDHLITLHQRKCEEIKTLKKYMLQKMFPQNGQSVPQIRFSGFTEDWEQRKLGDISSLITKGTTPKDKSGNGDVNFIKVENINDFSGDIVGMSKISLEEHQGYLKRSQLQEGDILFSIAGTLGRVTSVNKAILPANTNQALSIIRLKEGNLEYVKTCLKGNVVADFIRRNPTIGAQPNLSLEQVSNLEIEIPSEAEQEKIGACFQSLDNLITLHQQKCDELRNIKKFMLQNMFI